jgi:hypothetical protein
VISPSQGRYLHTEQHKHDLSVRASEDSSCLRLRSHCDWRTTEVSGFNSQQGQDLFLPLGPTESPTQCVLGVKFQGLLADPSPPSGVEVKNDGAILPVPHMISRYGV